MTRQLAAALAMTLLAVSTAAAQDARAVVERKTRPGDRLTIDLRDQDTIEGRLLTAGADLLTIQSAGGPVAIPYADIDRVRRRRNGVVLGALIGLGAGLTFGIPVRIIVNAESGDGDRALLALAAYGLGAGLAIDALLSLNRTVYRRSGKSVRFEIAPLPLGVTAGIRARW
jgi:hypothetical protein